MNTVYFQMWCVIVAFEAVLCVMFFRLLPSPSQPVADREDNRRAPSQVFIRI